MKLDYLDQSLNAGQESLQPVLGQEPTPARNLPRFLPGFPQWLSEGAPRVARGASAASVLSPPIESRRPLLIESGTHPSGSSHPSPSSVNLLAACADEQKRPVSQEAGVSSATASTTSSALAPTPPRECRSPASIEVCPCPSGSSNPVPSPVHVQSGNAEEQKQQVSQRLGGAPEVASATSAASAPSPPMECRRVASIEACPCPLESSNPVPSPVHVQFGNAEERKQQISQQERGAPAVAITTSSASPMECRHPALIQSGPPPSGSNNPDPSPDHVPSKNAEEQKLQVSPQAGGALSAATTASPASALSFPTECILIDSGTSTMECRRSDAPESGLHPSVGSNLGTSSVHVPSGNTFEWKRPVSKQVNEVGEVATIVCPTCTFKNSAKVIVCAMCKEFLRENVNATKRRLPPSNYEASKFPRQTAPSPGQNPAAGTVQNSPASGGMVQAPAQDEPPLSEKQEWLLNKLLKDNESVFFTGAAGTGKSRTLRELIRRTPEQTTFVTALTGIAATQLPRGTTLHSFSGMGLAKGTKEQCFQQAKSSGKGLRNWTAAKILIIDEASMMSKALFEKLDYVGRQMRRCDRPFGGVILCLCGDFFQLPPVNKGAAGDEGRFCFESEVWKQCLASSKSALENSFALTEIFRQKDERLLKLLSEVRHNEVTDSGLRSLSYLNRELKVTQGVEPTRLFPTNNRADAVNQERLAALPGGQGREATYECIDQLPSGLFQTADVMDNMMTFPRRLLLKVGAQVMLLKNTTQSLVNGSRGVVVGFQPDVNNELMPVVTFISGETTMVVRDKEQKDASGGRSFARIQVPLKLSWAITIHKSQGMSIDYLEVDLRSVFEAGQAYVALSRARTLEGLRVLSYDARKFWTNPKVKEFYKSRVQNV